MKKSFHRRKRLVFLASLLLIEVLAFSLFQLSYVSSRPARAATNGLILSPFSVPAAAVDPLGNRFVFWQGANDSNLWEGFYQANVSKWYGPVKITSNGHGMGPLGGEPTVVQVSTNALSTLGYAYQYVFWQGADPNRGLWEAYWDGSWHGPISLGMGQIDSTPSATFDVSTGTLTVAWVGSDNNIWYAYDSTATTPSHQSWSGARKAGWGPVGNAPTVADAGTGAVQVFWRGDDGYLWHGTLQAGGPPTFGPQQLPQAGLPGSDPSASGFQSVLDGSPGYTVFWQGGDGGLWEINWFPDGPGDPGGIVDPRPGELPHMGPLGSAPSCAFQPGTTPSNNYYCFWAGAVSPYNLWGASSISGNISGPTNLGMGSLQLG